ncbi:hypothetical protein ENTCAN_05326 [Enterobacter cancerogenus ATCC 35316]|nr:hypothetical protein ENTCAN_05326 [Enterobacter cancerogenus ATCC 35316]
MFFRLSVEKKLKSIQYMYIDIILFYYINIIIFLFIYLKRSKYGR